MSELHRLVEVVARLRAECPWDRDQTLESMRPYLLEEAHEVLDSIDQPGQPAVAEEVGDLLFVVLLLCEIGAGSGRFTLDSVAAGITAKMIARHPHVFGTPEQILAGGGTNETWEAAKHRQRDPSRSRLAGVPRSLPSLLRAFRQGEKAAAVGFDWPDHRGVLDKIREELAELEEAIDGGEPAQIAHEYGDLLLATANLGRHLVPLGGAAPEEALRAANDRFASRFAAMEELARRRGIDLAQADPEALDALWEEVKARVGQPDPRD